MKNYHKDLLDKENSNGDGPFKFTLLCLVNTDNFLVPLVTTTLAPEKENTDASRKIMDDFLKEGKLNPAIEPTQDGFNRIVSAWIIEDHHAWTTAESPGIRRVFDYLKCKFILPSDTTVHNWLGRIFIELHGRVVEELTVSLIVIEITETDSRF
jgi:hypothetical protein